MTGQPKIVTIGGGTGNFTLLKSLKKFTPHITALVSMSDDGGSTGVLRDELGVLPPGDVRQCLVALSEAPEEVRELFNFRFAKGSLQGHSFGNIFLSAVEKMTDDFNQAVRMAGDVLQITGQVLPVSLDNHRLVLHQNGEKIVGEYRIAQTNLATRPQLALEPAAGLNPAARRAIMEADLVVVAPGNFYASLVPAFLVDGMREAIQQTTAQLAYVCNLVNKPGQTSDFSVADYANELERFVGRGMLDFVLYNTDVPEDSLLQRYAVDGEYPVMFDAAALAKATYEAIPGNFLSRAEQQRNANDTRIIRSLIRHDGDAIARTLLRLLD